MNIFIALLSPFFYAATNLLDSKIEKQMGNNATVTTFYTIFTSVAFTILVAVYFQVYFPKQIDLIYLLPLAIINILYLIPYYKAIELADTSVVASLFSLNRIFVLAMAYIFLGEVLNSWQFAGFILIILGCFFLTFDWKKRHPKRVLYFMAFSTFLIASEGIILKLALVDLKWYELFVWTGLIVFILNLGQLFLPKLRRKIVTGFRNYKKNIGIILTEELFTFLGYACYVYSLSKMDLLLFKAIDSVQPLFVLFLAVISHKIFGVKLHEDEHLKNIEQKIFWFLVILLGVFAVMGWEK